MRRGIIMKKKIVNVLLSVAVVTTMMFTVTACGSKDDNKAPAETTAVNNVADETPSSEAAEAPSSEAAEAPSSEAADDKGAADGMTVDAWVNSDTAATYVSALNTSLASIGATIEFEADGDTLCMIFNYTEEALGTDGSDLTDDVKETIVSEFEKQFATIGSQLDPMCDVFKDEIGNPDLVVRIVYKSSNGTELFSKDI